MSEKPDLVDRLLTAIMSYVQHYSWRILEENFF